MSGPVIADNRPQVAELKKGEEYYFCTCGRSENQPFCDGTHKTFKQEQIGKEGPGVDASQAAPEAKPS